MNFNILKDIVVYCIQSIFGIFAIFGFVIALFVPNINEYKISLSLSLLVFVILVALAFISSFVQVLNKYYKKTFDFIEIRHTEQGNDVYWFVSDYFLNIGDTIKLVEYNNNGTMANVCIAKVHQKSETAQIGLLPILTFSNLESIKNKNCKIRPLHITTDDINKISGEIVSERNTNS